MLLECLAELECQLMFVLALGRIKETQAKQTGCRRFCSAGIINETGGLRN